MALVSEGMRARWEKLGERERLMAAGLAVAVVVFTLLLGIYLVGSSLGQLEDDNHEMRQALKDLDEKRDAYLKVKSKGAQLEARLGGGGVQLEGLLETAAKQSDVLISETTERQPVTLGNKKYIERAVDLRIRNVKLDALAKFLKRVETGQNLVVVTALSVRTRDDKHEDLEVEMTVSTWERAPQGKGGAKDKDKDKDKEAGGKESKG